MALTSSFGLPRPKPTTEFPPRFQHGTPDGYRFFLDMGPLPNADKKYLKGQVAFWNEAMNHPNYDEFWKARNIRPHLKRIKPAVMTVGGWFDAENLFGALNTYKSIEQANPGANNTLVMGPWFHGGWARSEGDFLGTSRSAPRFLCITATMLNCHSLTAFSKTGVIGSCLRLWFSKRVPTSGGCTIIGR